MGKSVNRQECSMLLIILLVGLPGCGGAAPGEAAASVVQSSGPVTLPQSAVSVQSLAARIWAPPDPKFALLNEIPDRSYYYWKMDDVPMAAFGPSPVLTEEGTAAYQTVHSTGSKFSRRVVKFPKPRGQFLELLLLVHNEGDTDFSRQFSSGGSFASHVRLQNEQEPEVLPVDFLTPGLSNASFEHLAKLQGEGLTVVSEHSGNLELYLEPGGETWILLLFDVPADTRSAVLKLGDSSSIVFEW